MLTVLITAAERKLTHAYFKKKKFLFWLTSNFVYHIPAADQGNTTREKNIGWLSLAMQANS